MTTDVEQVLREAMREEALRALDDTRDVPSFPHDSPLVNRRLRSARAGFVPLTVAAVVALTVVVALAVVALVNAPDSNPPAAGTTESLDATGNPPSPIGVLAVDVAHEPDLVVAGVPVTFTVHGTGMTAEADGHISEPVVSFGDGSSDGIPASDDRACSDVLVPIDDAFTVPHTYAEPGTYQLTVTIESCGLTETRTLDVEVVEAPVTPPTVLSLVVAYTPERIVAGTTVTFAVEVRGMSPETDGHIDSPLVSFGDGTPDVLAPNVDSPCSGVPVAINDRFPVPHTYAQPGIFRVTVTIGSCGVAHTQTITVTVEAP